MKSILADATSFVFTDALLNGEAKPAAINIFNLSNIIESIVLHEEIKVVNTAYVNSEASEQLRSSLLGLPAETISVLDISYFEIMEKMLMEIDYHYSYNKANGTLGDFYSRHELSRSTDKVCARVLNKFRSEDYKPYKEILKEVYDHYFEKTQRKMKKKPRLGLHTFSGLEWSDIFHPKKAFLQVAGNIMFPNGLFNLPESDNSFLVSYRDGAAILDAHNDIYRMGDPSGGSSFAQWRATAGWKYGTFEESILLRAGMYIELSEQQKIPYKADFLRSPIIWNYFQQGNPQQLSVEQNLFDLAEQYEEKRNNLLNTFLKNQSMVMLTPLILRAVLKEATKKGDIIPLALQMRETASAKKFRTACVKLEEHIENEEFEAALRDIQWALSKLSSDIKSPPNEALYSLLSIPSESIKGYTSPVLGASLAADKLVKGGFQLYDWWHSRKYAFVSKVITQARKAKSLNTEIKRLFKREIPDDEIVLLDHLEKMKTSL